MACQHCIPYGNPGLLPKLLPRTPEELRLPEAERPPAKIKWIPCTCMQHQEEKEGK